MAFNNNANRGFKKNGNNKNTQNNRPKPIKIIVPLNTMFGVTDRNGNFIEVDTSECLDVLDSLCQCNVFNLMNVTVSMNRSLYDNDNTKKGTMTVGVINDIGYFNADEGDDDYDVLKAELTIFGSSVETISKIMESKNLMLDCKVKADREGKFQRFTGFNLVVSK